jgi:spore coat protein U-like protein
MKPTLAVMLAFLLFGPTAAEAGCTVSVWAGVSFGGYDVFSQSPLDSAGRISYKCDQGHNYHVRISITRGQGTTYAARALRFGSDLLNYNLFLDAARTAVWGDESEGTQAFYDSGMTLNRENLPVFGRIPAGQDVRVGAYSDAVTVVIDF